MAERLLAVLAVFAALRIDYHQAYIANRSGNKAD
jgi:hypothetical protein